MACYVFSLLSLCESRCVVMSIFNCGLNPQLKWLWVSILYNVRVLILEDYTSVLYYRNKFALLHERCVYCDLISIKQAPAREAKSCSARETLLLCNSIVHQLVYRRSPLCPILRPVNAVDIWNHISLKRFLDFEIFQKYVNEVPVIHFRCVTHWFNDKFTGTWFLLQLFLICCQFYRTHLTHGLV